MSHFVNKCKKVLNGCMHKQSIYNKYDSGNDWTDPILVIDEFKYENEIEKQAVDNSVPLNATVVSEKSKFTIYTDSKYDNLQHIPKKKKPTLKDTTNISKPRGLKMSFLSSSQKNNCIKDENNNDITNQNFDYAELYNENADLFHKNKLIFTSASQYKIETNTNGESNTTYCEIPEDNDMCLNEDYPLIDLKEQNKNVKQELSSKKQALFDNNKSLFSKYDENQENNHLDIQSLTEIRDLSTFSSQSEGFHWYLNLIIDTVSKCIESDKTLKDADRTKRINVATAHLLYARNFYEMKIANSSQLNLKLARVHPCLIALACLLDSDAVKIVESHYCVCDSYIHLFSTRVKYCAWKSKLFILLKRPKRSSFDRLSLIEDLINCHKTIQEKTPDQVK